MQDYEKLGAFYLGRRWDPAAGKLTDELVLYDSPDLTTHAVIIGMTGSGKTGLGISLLEEAAIDRIPVIAIDPKGDLGNLLLTFPELNPADFEPWVDAQAAAAAGKTVPEFAASQAEAWRQGLAGSGQGPERIARLKAAAEFAIYTPGSTAGLSLSVLGSFSAPPEALRADADLYRQHIGGVVTGLLTLVGIEADPVGSREHILLSSILDHQWQQGRSLDLGGLIGAIQNPGVQKIGVLDLESFYPAKDRFTLAMRLNNLLAAPGFQAWTQGEPLDAGRLLFTADGRPRVSVMSIAHLGDAERMFFVTLLLNEIVAWMRSQSGTSSLRAILYMDEVFGFLPPVAAPPSKVLLLTLLKQARAFGLGVVLSTQNPVDLDYKALSNAGTWFIGRLQTEQDRNRVRDGLLAAAPTEGLDAGSLDATLASLGKRTFLLHNVHEKGPVLMQTRWAMAYLRGPLTREDIRRLTTAPARPMEAAPAAPPVIPRPVPPASGQRPVLPPSIPVAFVRPKSAPAGRLVYQPRLLGAARVGWVSTKHGVDLKRDVALALEGGGPVDWRNAEPVAIDPASLAKEPDAGIAFAELPAGLADPAIIKSALEQFRTWLRTEQPVVLRRSAALKLVSEPDEPEGAFRARLQLRAREARDQAIARLRQQHAAKYASLQDRLHRAEQAVGREKEQATGSKIDAAVSMGAAVLGAFLGRKAISTTSAGRAASALRKAGNAQRQSGDVERATETVAKVRGQIADLESQVQSAVAALEAGFDAQSEPLEEISVRPATSDITVQFCGIAWLPFIEDDRGNLTSAL
ncbi:MAG: ATP-binding protein [Chromatiales bacterium]|nr:ATP-binding protein [Chromatiales bacterium]